MKPLQGGAAGMLTGLLFGIAICLVQNIPVSDALFRMAVLTGAGGWMGLLLAWLNQLLPSKHDDNSEQRDAGA
jgi:hypothetical protein